MAQDCGSLFDFPRYRIYSNLMYYAGWKAPDRTHGHGAYAQNKDGYKKFRQHHFQHASMECMRMAPVRHILLVFRWKQCILQQWRII